ncbi:MAG: ectonucleotide pyrophosphatase/phosphodiesterase [Vicinamibacteria bacterium]
MKSAPQNTFVRMPLTLASLALFVVAATKTGAQTPVAAVAGAPARATDHVFLITIDGFRPAVYLDSEKEGVRLPNLQALRAAGSSAEGVMVSYPSMTYPSHTSIVTAVSPARHGIITNTILDPEHGSRLWFYENSAVKVPEIWDAARAAGLKTAGVSWPVTVGAKIDVIYPESNQVPTDSTWLARARKDSTPGLVDAVVADLGGFGERDNLDPVKRDRFATAVAKRIIKTEKPNLMVMHLMQTDSAQHADGPGSPSARQAYENIDAHIGEIIKATEEAGIRERTTFVITGDHGFSRVHSLFQPNVVLRDAGLLKADDKGNITEWQAVLHGMAIMVHNPAAPSLAEKVTNLFDKLAAGEYKGLFRVVKRKELDERGAYPGALLFLEPAEGYYLSDGFEQNAFLVGTTRRGAHGFLPTEPRMYTGLIMSGPGIRPNVPLPLVRQIDIAPTIGKLLGFTMPKIDGTPIVGVLETKRASRGEN